MSTEKTYRGRITGQIWLYRSKKECRDTREKNTDRDDVGRACTRHVQMKKRLTVEKKKESIEKISNIIV